MNLLQELYKRFQPEVPVGPDHSEWYEPRTDTDTVYTIRRAVKVSGDLPPRVLLLGGVGSGKSTELQQMLTSRDGLEHAVYFDVHGHFVNQVGDIQALDALESWELAGLVTLAVARPGLAKFVHDGALGEAVAAFTKGWQALLPTETERQSSTLDIGNLVGGVAVLALSDSLAPGAAAALKTLGSVVKWTVKLGKSARRGGREEQDPLVQHFVAAANTLLRVLANRFNKPLLAIVDGLDRVTNSETALRLVARSTLLQKMECGLVVAAPVMLRHDLRLVQASNFSEAMLTTVPVLDADAPAEIGQPGPGVKLLRQLFWRRCRDLPDAKDVITDHQLDELAWYSGGHLRTYLHLIREVLAFAITDDLTTVTPAAVSDALRQRRKMFSIGVDREDVVAALLAVRDAKDRTTLPPGDEVDILRDNLRILTYQGADDVPWHYVHPLLLARLESSRPRGR